MMNKLIFTLAMAATLWSERPAHAHDPAAFPSIGENFSTMVGSWSGEGTMAGSASEATLTISPVLGDQFVELDYKLSPSGFSGKVMYRLDADGRMRGDWFDNRGVRLPMEAVRTQSGITVNWGIGDRMRGRTVYLLREDGKLEVSDYTASATGEWKVFAQHIYRRD